MDEKKLWKAKVNFRILSITNILIGLLGTWIIIEIKKMSNPGLGAVPILAAPIFCSIFFSIASYILFKAIEANPPVSALDKNLVLFSIFYPGIVNFILLNTI